MSKQTWTGWYQALINHMQQMDVNVQAIQSQAGIKTTNPELLQITQDDMTHLWNAALDACGDKALGLKVGQNLRPNAIGTVSWAMMSSNTVGDAIDVLMQHQHLLADALDFSLIKHEKHVEVVLNNIGDKIPASPLSIDASVMAFLTYLRWLTRDKIQFSAVHFNRSKVSSFCEVGPAHIAELSRRLRDG